MKSYKKKSLSDTISTVGSMLLFLLFAVCMLLIIAVAAGTYSRISNNFDKTFGVSASLRYISNKVKSADNTTVDENGSVLYIKNGDNVDILYFENGALFEKTVSTDNAMDLSGGSEIFDIDNLFVCEQGNLIKITVKLDNEEKSTYIRRG